MKRRHFLQTGLAFGTAMAVTPTSANASGAKETKTDPGKSGEKNEPFKKIKIVQIGVRHEHSDGKMAELRNLPDYFDVLGIAAESPEWEKRHKKDNVYKGLKWFDRKEILDLPGLEAVAVETEMTELMPTAVECAKRKLPMHVDKPLGEDLDQCKQMLDLCRKNNVLMQPGYMFRGNPAVQLGIKAVRNGWLGEITDIYATMNRYDLSPGFRKWLAGYRGGGMFDFGSHIIDIVVSMIGAPDEIKVIENPYGKDGLNDNTVSLLLYPKTIAQMRVNQLEYQGNLHRRLIVAGTAGTFELYPIEGTYTSYPTFTRDPLNVRLTLKNANSEYKAGTHYLKIDSPQGRYSEQLIDFAKYIRGTKTNPYSLDYEFLVQKIILAASGYIPWKKEKA